MTTRSDPAAAKIVIDLCSSSSSEDEEDRKEPPIGRAAATKTIRRSLDTDTDVEIVSDPRQNVAARRKRQKLVETSAGQPRQQPFLQHPGQPYATAPGSKNQASNFCDNSSTTASATSSRCEFTMALMEEGEGDNAVVTEGLSVVLHTHSTAVNECANTLKLRTCCDTAISSSSLGCLCHIQQQDKFSCGYRNTQMILTSLCHFLPLDHPYYEVREKIMTSPLQHNHHMELRAAATNGLFVIPSVQTLQKTMEAAWSAGMDSEGARHYSHRIVGKTDFIGAAEVWTLFAYWKMDACLVQFVKCRESRRLLGPFCAAYFASTESCSLCAPDLTTSSRSRVEQLLRRAENPVTNGSLPDGKGDGSLPSTAGRTCTCPVFPIYLQWSGHSVTIVGVEYERDNDKIPSRLLVLDPMVDGKEYQSGWNNSAKTRSNAKMYLPMSKLECKDCQVIVVSPRPSSHVGMNAVTAAHAAVHRLMFQRRP